MYSAREKDTPKVSESAFFFSRNCTAIILSQLFLRKCTDLSTIVFSDFSLLTSSSHPLSPIPGTTFFSSHSSHPCPSLPFCFPRHSIGPKTRSSGSFLLHSWCSSSSTTTPAPPSHPIASLRIISIPIRLSPLLHATSLPRSAFLRGFIRTSPSSQTGLPIPTVALEQSNPHLPGPTFLPPPQIHTSTLTSIASTTSSRSSFSPSFLGFTCPFWLSNDSFPFHLFDLFSTITASPTLPTTSHPSPLGNPSLPIRSATTLHYAVVSTHSPMFLISAFKSPPLIDPPTTAHPPIYIPTPTRLIGAPSPSGASHRHFSTNKIACQSQVYKLRYANQPSLIFLPLSHSHLHGSHHLPWLPALWSFSFFFILPCFSFFVPSPNHVPSPSISQFSELLR